MKARRSSLRGLLCPSAARASWVLVGLAAFGSVENSGAAAFENRPTAFRAADERAVSPQATPTSTLGTGNAGAATAAESSVGAASDPTASSDAPKSTVTTALSDPAQIPPTENRPLQSAQPGIPPRTGGDVQESVDSVEILDECFVVDACIDRYLWALYQRTPKEDTIKVEERKSVTIRRKRKIVTVTKTLIKLVDEDFAWKDPKAAGKAGMPLMDYVIGGMDRNFKLKLFHMLYAAEEAGLSPGITSAFRDDYRQSIASGLKAASDRSYHGGSLRGGYGHGLAADVVSIKGDTRDQRWVSSESLWKWIDAHAKAFGLGRPYLDRDPPHVAPIDGQEYAAHHRGTTAQHAGSDSKKRKRLIARAEHNPGKHPGGPKPSKVRAI